MPPAERLPRARVRPARRRRGRFDPRRVRLVVAVLLAALVALVTLGSTLRGGSSGPPGGPIPPKALLPSGPPQRQMLARQGNLSLFVPIDQDLITAIAYHPVAESRAFSLEPAGHQANANLFRRLYNRVFGDQSGGVRYFVSSDSTDAVDVGAMAGTEVYAPVDGQVVSLTPEVYNGQRFATTVGIQPTDNPSVIVQVSHLTLQQRHNGLTVLRVGERVQAAATLLGHVADLSSVIRSDLRQYVSDKGNNASVEVDPAPTIPLP
jgi:hypothetical protein